MQSLSDRYATHHEGWKALTHHEGWKALWLAVAGVLAITMTWDVLMLSLDGISDCVGKNKPATEKKTATKLSGGRSNNEDRVRCQKNAAPNGRLAWSVTSCFLGTDSCSHRPSVAHL